MKKSKAIKRKEAIQRQEKYDSLTTEQKISLAKSRTGKSKKEILRLNKQKGIKQIGAKNEW